MKSLMKKTTVLLLTLAMVFSLFPVSGSAAEEPYAAGRAAEAVEPEQTEVPEAADEAGNETAELMADGITINSDHFKPASFREYVLTRDTNKNYVLEPAEIEAIEAIDLTCKDGESEIAGLQYVTALKSLRIRGNDLETLDVSGCPNLKELDCGNSKLTSLDLSGCPGYRQMHKTADPGLR